jgi:phage shock protein PspC (stress-responsive transcriptional regulator)|tara:strand:+ start:328 stop:516 length:189 start_codon:yes stop_codon:yes gene_type:complete
MKTKKLFRSSKNRMVAGVCAGIGEYFGTDPTVIRLLWVLLTIFSIGGGILAYLIAWIIIPEK